MALQKVKFIILDTVYDTDAAEEATTGAEAVVLRLQFEHQPEPDPRALPFLNRSALERTFEIAGLAPCLLNPAELDTFWSVTDEQMQQLADGSAGRLPDSLPDRS
jgi:hypothetical protein